MTGYIDAIIHIANLPGLLAHFAADHPERLSDDGQSIVGFTWTPMVASGAAALCYVRMTPDEAEDWRGTPGITILAEAPYDPAAPGDAVYAAVLSDPAALALYDAVYPRAEVTGTNDDGTAWSYTPPDRFGVLA